MMIYLNPLEWVVIVIVGTVLLAVPIAIIHEQNEPTISLNKSEWECAEHKTHMWMMYTGKVWIPQSRTECIVYRRVGY